MEFIPSSYQMRTSVLKRLTEMFCKTDIHPALALLAYKECVDRKLRYTKDFHKGDNICLKRPPTEAKTQKEKEENILQSKVRFKLTGPYEV